MRCIIIGQAHVRKVAEEAERVPQSQGDNVASSVGLPFKRLFYFYYYLDLTTISHAQILSGNVNEPTRAECYLFCNTVAGLIHQDLVSK